MIDTLWLNDLLMADTYSKLFLYTANIFQKNSDGKYHIQEIAETLCVKLSP